MKYFVYILKCVNNIFYTGLTVNLRKRLYENSHGLSTFTRSRLPVNLVYYEIANTRGEARRREVVIKDMSQKRKIEMIDKFTSRLTGKFTSSVSEKRE